MISQFYIVFCGSNDFDASFTKECVCLHLLETKEKKLDLIWFLYFQKVFPSFFECLNRLKLDEHCICFLCIFFILAEMPQIRFLRQKIDAFFSAPFVTPGSYLLPLGRVHCLGRYLGFNFSLFRHFSHFRRIFVFAAFWEIEPEQACFFFTQENANHYCVFIFIFCRLIFIGAGSNGSTSVRFGFVGLPDNQVDGLVRLLDNDDGDSIASHVSHEQQQLSPGSGSTTRDPSSGKFFPSSGMYVSRV